VQDWLGAENAGAFDLSAGCTGFIYALNLAAQTIVSGAADAVLVIGAETLSRIVDWQDRGTCILFGDGAGAVVLRASNTPGGVLTTFMRSDGSGGELLSLPGGGSRYPPSSTTVLNGMHKIHMNGREVFRFATRAMAQATRTVVEDAGLTLDDVALVIPHQANIRIIEAAARGLNLPVEKMYVNVDRYGNTSSASIPIALCEAIESGRIKPDDNVVLVGFGAGLTWGATTIKWVPTPPPASPLEQRAHEVRYWWASLRSAWRRFWRRLESWIMGPAAKPEK
jgi:3-oxoacyl-[acyl-carrier-protein] synthase-3